MQPWSLKRVWAAVSGGVAPVPEVSTLLLFAAACAALFAIPGPAVVYIVARTVAHGRRAGLVSVLGIEAGALVHLAAAALGLSALIASSATAFAVVRYAGAAYLILLGIQALRRSGQPVGRTAPLVPADRRLFRDGVLVNVLNPKVAVFFLAFLPQFIEPSAGSVPAQMLVLGAVYVVVALLLDAGWALLAAVVGRVMTVGRNLERASAGVYFALGVAAAVTGERPRR